MTTNETLTTLAIAQLKPSKSNPRHIMDGTLLAELTASVREHGILQPLLVRPNGDGRFEVVAGHRRFAAAKAAERETVPVFIRELSDVEVLEIQVIENQQRADLHPLEEAEGYKALLAHKGYDVPRIADRVGRSVKYVYDRVKLADLIPDLKLFFLAGEISAGHAIILGRLKPKDQSRCLKDGLFTHEKLLWHDDTTTGRDSRKPISVRELDSWVDENVRFEAKDPDPMLFPETAVAIASAAKVVPITRQHYIRPETRDGRTFFPQSWKRADGTRKSKKCDHSVMGFVAVGPGRGEAFPVCVSKEKCTVHWAEQVRSKKRSAAKAARSSSAATAPKGGKSAETMKREEALRSALDAAHQAANAEIAEAAMNAAAKLSPEKFLRTYLQADTWLLEEFLSKEKARSQATMSEWAKKAPIADLQRALTYNAVANDVDELLDMLGVDASKILAAHEKIARDKLKAEKPAPPAKVKGKAKAKRRGAK